MRTIEVIVSPTGDTKIQTRGYTGSECLQASKALEQALGIITAETKTSEFFETATNEQHVRQE